MFESRSRLELELKVRTRPRGNFSSIETLQTKARITTDTPHVLLSSLFDNTEGKYTVHIVFVSVVLFRVWYTLQDRLVNISFCLTF